MKREIFNKEKNKYANFFVIIFFFFLLCLTIRLGYLCLADKVDGISLKDLSKKRITAKETLYSLRGTIYDTNNETLAQTINSYKIIAYLEKNRGEGYYVKDKKEAAKKLSTVLELSEDKIYKILSKDAYQVEFGSKGKGLNELQKEAIENLGLDGIDFSYSSVNGSDIIINAQYEVKLPFSFFGEQTISLSKSAKTKAFKKIADNNGYEEPAEEE